MAEAKLKRSRGYLKFRARERAFAVCNVLNFSFSHRHLIKYSVIIIKLLSASL
jgi:hypothetical protein